MMLQGSKLSPKHFVWTLETPQILSHTLELLHGSILVAQLSSKEGAVMTIFESKPHLFGKKSGFDSKNGHDCPLFRAQLSHQY